MDTRPTSPRFSLKPGHYSFLLSVIIHLVILSLIGAAWQRSHAPVPEKLQVFYVTTEEEPPVPEDMAPAIPEKPEEPASPALSDAAPPSADRPPELPSQAYPTGMPRQSAPAAEREPLSGNTPEAPPPLPGDPASGDPLPYPTGTPSIPSAPADEGTPGPASAAAGIPAPSGPQGSGTGNGSGTGRRVAATNVEGCKLFILPPQDSPIPLAKAVSLCEGITPSEERHAKRMEIKMALSTDGEPVDYTLVRSCGNRKLDEEVQSLLPLMRFETPAHRDMSSFYLTMVIIFSEARPPQPH